MVDIPKNKKVILFDGVCNLCNNAITTVIKNDHKNVFVFAALQSKIGSKIVDELKIDTAKIDSIILYEPALAYYIKSEAAFKIMNAFGGPWKLVKIFSILPTKINDFFYDIVAKNRYKWFGKKDVCMIPTAELQAKFLK